MLSCIALAANTAAQFNAPVAPAVVGDPYALVPTDSGDNGLFPLSGIFQAGSPVAHAGAPMVLEAPVVATPIGTPIVNQGGLFPRLRSRVDGRLYFSTDLLVWGVSGMESPSLVTTSPAGTPQDTAGVLGEAGTSTLFGASKLNDGATAGVRIAGGWWMTRDRSIALETEYIGVGQHSDSYSGSGNGSPILARPFFDIVNGQETARLVSYPGLVAGNIDVATESQLRSFLINARIGVGPTPCHCQQCGMRDRTDLIMGYRALRLRDSLVFNESLESLDPATPGSLAVQEEFQTTNEFSAFQLGLVHRKLVRKRSWLESMVRVAIGNNRQRLVINGRTRFTESGVTDEESGGLYALRSNIGDHRRDEFVIVPELGLKFGTRLTKCLHATIGYSVLYFPNVIRATEQIDRDINPNLIPDEVVPLTGAFRPRVLWVRNNYIAHGLSFGGELQF